MSLIEKYVCDRCGNEINVKSDTMFRSVRQIRVKEKEIEPLVVKKELEEIKSNLKEFTENITIETYFKSRIIDYHLCKKCCGDFKRFMKG